MVLARTDGHHATETETINTGVQESGTGAEDRKGIARVEGGGVNPQQP